MEFSYVGVEIISGKTHFWNSDENQWKTWSDTNASSLQFIQKCAVEMKI